MSATTQGGLSGAGVFLFRLDGRDPGCADARRTSRTLNAKPTKPWCIFARYNSNCSANGEAPKPKVVGFTPAAKDRMPVSGNCRSQPHDVSGSVRFCATTSGATQFPLAGVTLSRARETIP